MISTQSPPRPFFLTRCPLDFKLTWRLPGLLLVAPSLELSANVPGSLWVDKAGLVFACPWAAAAVSGCFVDGQRWIELHVTVRASFGAERWSAVASQLVQNTPVWLPCCWLQLIGVAPRLLRRLGERGRSMVGGFSSLRLGMLLAVDCALDAGDVSSVWIVWPWAAESAWVDAYVWADVTVSVAGINVGRRCVVADVLLLGSPKESLQRL